MEEQCTHNCATCASSCTNKEEQEKDFFARIENLVDELGKEEVVNMLENISKEIDQM